ncbi:MULTISPECIES: hypothetical protein [Methanothermobacter]|jgi:hypothetical protein|uniref:Uncharacterized protein n=1 Tax=Methanothermobacter thermautotrophicus (strain ATCC 29096 / DSM 1053 / JCM 10044 / NBRC 100330 / Delta H) TaxID=187420 RepID=O26584_METTH|nr:MULTISPECIES: hypothetical protein [Methanothermobacter]AAB84990.1 unknown [Methanothermobacter thermautotrophicus str. Delta H]WBF06757.1 hypothetical protein ISG35_02250 [Methanothermobacter thermautotrophicus]BAZ98525.1 hypothetical protein tca_00450 [Methanothermobacter sp. EMTCatA1]
MIILIMKTVAFIFMLLAAVLSVKNYFMTRFASGLWALVSMALLTGSILLFVRLIKEFLPFPELEVVKICLLPVMMAFIFAASFELKRDILKPL